MKDRLAEQKVQVRQIKGRVQNFVWTWACVSHDCQAEKLWGWGKLFEPVVHAGDEHARRWHHHRHLGHDL